MLICERDVSKLPLKYKIASSKKIAKKLSKLPKPTGEKKELVIQTSRGKIII